VARYLAADLHFDHSEVLDYTDRPFASVGEMNDRLLDNWNAVVDHNDQVIFLGDLVVPSEPTTVRRWLRRLNGEITFVIGDHDEGVRRTRAATARQEYRFEAGGYEFLCLHDPADAPPGRTDWLVHGHHHDMRPGEFPFIDPENSRSNVAVELTGYEPVPVAELVDHIQRRERLRTRS
jgi:calcineurin-like phosphoesterase family protein